MNLLTRVGALMNPTAAQAMSFNDAVDDRWYGPVVGSSWSGVSVTADTALGIPTFWACYGLITETLASLPLHVYRDRPVAGRDKVPDYWLYSLLHEQPNDQQDAFQWFEYLTGQMILRGHAYALKVPSRDRNGTFKEFIPIDADNVTIERLPNGRIRYRVRQLDGTIDVVNDEDILHILYKGGMSVITAMRQTLGATVAQEQYAAAFYANGAGAGLVFEHPTQMTEDAQKRFKASWDGVHRGAGNAYKTAVLEEGMKVAHIGLTQEDAQYIQTAEFRAEELCRTLRIPPHMVGLTSKVTSWGTGIEQMSIGFVTYTLLPWLRRWEQAINRQLITEDDRALGYYASFNVDGLLRGDTAARGQFYATMRQWGAFSANDILDKEGMNRIPNGDIYLQPLNFVEAGTEPAPPPDNVTQFPAAAAAVDPAIEARYQAMLVEAAGRLVRKEVTHLTAIAKRSASDSEAWATAVYAFYDAHAALVAKTMHVELAAAVDYCDTRSAIVSGGGVATIQAIEATGADDLVALALADRDKGEDQ